MCRLKCTSAGDQSDQPCYGWITLVFFVSGTSPKGHCLSLATSKKPIMIARCAHITLVNNTMFNGLPIGSNTLWPDWQSLRKTNAGGDDNVYASVMCRTREPDTKDLDTDYRH